MSRQPLSLPCRHLLLPWLMAVVLLGGCDSQPPAPPAGTGKPPASGQVAKPGTRIATAQSAASETRSVSTDQAEEGGKPDEGTLVLPSDPPESNDTFAPSSPAAPDAVPSRTPAQDKASAPQAIDDATALHVLKSNHCTSCHQPERKVVGPAFRDIGRRHAGHPDAGRQLAASILGGSNRNWGPVPMPPQPHVNDRDLKIIVDWILQQH